MIVWARVPDRNGVVKDQPRPLVIINVHPTDKKAPFVACCISTRPQKETDEPIIELPWDEKTGGVTGFYRWCALVLRWRVIVEQSAVDANIPSRELPAELFERIKKAIDDDKTWR